MNSVRISPLPPETHERSRRRILRDAGVVLFFGAVFLFFLVVVFGNQGLVALNQTSARMRQVEKDLEGVRAENAALRESLEALDKSAAAVEGIAREELRMAKPGEHVYVFVERPAR